MIRYVDGADHHLFAADQFKQIHGHVRVMALQRDDIDVGRLQFRKRLFILSPFRAQRLFPVGIGFNPISIADMYGGFTLKPFNGSFQGGDAPVIHLVKEHVKCGLIKLNNVDACGLELFGFLIEDLRELPG